VEDIYFIIDNVVVYYSQDGLDGIITKLAFVLVGYGHHIVKNSNLAVKIAATDDIRMCVYDDPPTFHHIYENLHFEIGEFDTSTDQENSLSTFTQLSANAIYNFTVSNLTFVNVNAQPGQWFVFHYETRGTNSYIYIQDITFKNVYSALPLMAHYGPGTYSMKNIIIQDCITDNNPLIVFTQASELIMDNISINNSTVISDFTGELIDIVRFHSFIF
jgi:hypothetical protein